MANCNGLTSIDEFQLLNSKLENEGHTSLVFKLTPLNIPEMKKKLILNPETECISQNNYGNNGLWVWYFRHHKMLSIQHYFPKPY